MNIIRRLEKIYIGSELAIPLGNSVPLSGVPAIDGLTQGSRWNSGNLTYSLWDNLFTGIWDNSSKDIVRTALQQFENVANLNFTEVSSTSCGYAYCENYTSDLSFLLTGITLSFFGATGFAVFPDYAWGNSVLANIGTSRTTWPSPEGTILLDNLQLPFQFGAQQGGSGFTIIMHEIGHALGLKHPHDDGGNFRPTFSQQGIEQFNNATYTVMSYNDSIGSSIPSGNPSTLMPLDILALQYIYGANMSYQADDTVWTPTGTSDATIWDAGGTDVLDASGWTTSNIIDIREGFYSLIGGSDIGIAINVVIENANGGAGNDTINGNDTHNALNGNEGNDLINGMDGNDIINGNVGLDAISGGNGNDVIRGGADNDALSGNDGNDQLFGDLGDDLVFGGIGNDIIDGGPRRTINGDGDTDTLHGESGDDSINGNIGNDNITGGIGNDFIRGGKGDDTIIGEAGNDTIFGDKGNDLLNGGTGANIFVFNADSGIDIIEDFVSGTDKIQISSSVVATASAAVAAFSVGVLDLGAGNTITFVGIISLIEADVIIT